MRILVIKVSHEKSDRFTWMVAYSLPFTPVGACNDGAAGDYVSLRLTVPKTAREEKAQDVFRAHVNKIGHDMHKNVYETYHSPEDIVACGAPGMSLSWVTDHVTKGADHE
jgi:hypothetical protein